LVTFYSELENNDKKSSVHFNTWRKTKVSEVDRKKIKHIHIQCSYQVHNDRNMIYPISLSKFESGRNLIFFSLPSYLWISVNDVIQNDWDKRNEYPKRYLTLPHVAIFFFTFCLCFKNVGHNLLLLGKNSYDKYDNGIVSVRLK